MLHSPSALNSDLLKMQDWAYQWKISFNPDQTKQAQEVNISRRNNKTTDPPFFFNNFEIKFSPNQKHLGITLDSKLSFDEQINEKIHQANKGVDQLQILQTILPHTSLLSIYKPFIRYLLDYADVIYGPLSNALFSKKKKSFQYNAAPAIMGTITPLAKNCTMS